MCTIHVDIYHTVPVLVTTVFQKMSPRVRKNAHVQDIVKIKVKLSLTNLHFVCLHCIFFSQCTLQKNIKWIFTKWYGGTCTGFIWLRVGTDGGHL